MRPGRKLALIQSPGSFVVNVGGLCGLGGRCVAANAPFVPSVRPMSGTSAGHPPISEAPEFMRRGLSGDGYTKA